MTESPRIRVLIVDDHAMVRRGMRDFLDLHDDLEVVGEASDGEGALEAVETFRPDVVVMDLVMPGLDGIAATAAIKARYPAIEVVAITSFIEEDRITAAIEAASCSRTPRPTTWPLPFARRMPARSISILRWPGS